MLKLPGSRDKTRSCVTCPVADGQRDDAKRAGGVTRRAPAVDWQPRGRHHVAHQTLADDGRRRHSRHRGTASQPTACGRDQQPHRPSSRRRRQCRNADRMISGGVDTAGTRKSWRRRRKCSPTFTLLRHCLSWFPHLLWHSSVRKLELRYASNYTVILITFCCMMILNINPVHACSWQHSTIMCYGSHNSIWSSMMRTGTVNVN